MAETPSFEIPPELREMAEKNVEQARAAYGQFMDFLTQAMGAWATSPGSAELGAFSDGVDAPSTASLCQSGGVDSHRKGGVHDGS